MASLDDAFSGRRMDNNELIDPDRSQIIERTIPIERIVNDRISLGVRRLNRPVNQNNDTESIEFGSADNSLPINQNNEPLDEQPTTLNYITPELRENLNQTIVSNLLPTEENNTLILPPELRQLNGVVPMPEASRQNQVDNRNGFGGVGEINVTRGGPRNAYYEAPLNSNTRVAYHEEPNSNLKERKSNKILEAAEKRRLEPKKEGFFKKLFKKEVVSEVPEPKEPNLKKLLNNLCKIKKDHAEVSVKLKNLELSLEQNKVLLEKSRTKFKDLIDVSEDQELIDILNKKMESNPLIEKNENIKKEIDELAKEYCILTENCDSLAAICPQNLCSVCFNSEVESFNQCGHAFCNGCISKIKKCDKCKEDIRNTKKIFYS
jgi:hypothetical protein